MTLYAPLILLGLPRNHHMHHLPTSDITRSSQDQIKLGINNTVVIIKWPQGAWSLPMILAQHHEYPTTRYPRYHGDHSRITNGTTLGSTGYLVTKRWSFRRSQPWPTLGLKRWSFRRSQPWLTLGLKRWSFQWSQPWPTLGLQHQNGLPTIIFSTVRRS